MINQELINLVKEITKENKELLIKQSNEFFIKTRDIKIKYNLTFEPIPIFEKYLLGKQLLYHHINICEDDLLRDKLINLIKYFEMYKELEAEFLEDFDLVFIHGELTDDIVKSGCLDDISFLNGFIISITPYLRGNIPFEFLVGKSEQEGSFESSSNEGEF